MTPGLPVCLQPPDDESRWSPPLDVCDVVVRLETAGVTDNSAANYGYRSAWQLAEASLPWLKLYPARGAEAARRYSLAIEYFRGLSFAFPLLICCLAMLWFRFSLWGGDVSSETAAAIGLGTVSSFIVTGGFVQATARRGLFFLGIQNPARAAAASLSWTRAGIIAIAASGLLFFGLASFYRWLPPAYVPLAVAFHASLGSFWISTGLLHMLDRAMWSGVATALGVGVVAGLYSGLGIALAPAQIVGILAASACSFAAAALHIRTRTRRAGGAVESTSLISDAVQVWPYFAFGCLYYVLLFTDRLLAWTAPDFSAAAPVQFRGDYETALDVVLLAFVIQAGFVRWRTIRFFEILASAQRNAGPLRRTAFHDEMRRVFRSGLYRFLPVILLGSAAALALAEQLGVLDNPQGRFVLLWGLAACPLLVGGLWNASLLFRLSLPIDVIGAIAPAVAIDIVAGYLVTRLGADYLAVCGLALGSFYFFAATTTRLQARIRALDYHYFSAAL